MLFILNEMSSRYIKLILILLASNVAVAYLLLSGNFVEEQLRICIAWSAKIAAFLFSVAFGVSSFQYLFKDAFSRKLVSVRADIGLSFATFHTAHLIFLLMLQVIFHPVFDLAKSSSLLGGGMAYIFMYAMAITTFPSVKKKISSRRWNLLHLIGSYWIWLIFFRSYFKNVINKGEEYFMFSILSLVLVLRIICRLRLLSTNRISD